MSIVRPWQLLAALAAVTTIHVAGCDSFSDDPPLGSSDFGPGAMVPVPFNPAPFMPTPGPSTMFPPSMAGMPTMPGMIPPLQPGIHPDIPLIPFDAGLLDPSTIDDDAGLADEDAGQDDTDGSAP